jgi:hypothetical protein
MERFSARSSASIRDCVGPSVGPLVGRSVCSHITSKTGYVAIASRRGGGRAKLVTSKTDHVAIPLRLGIR